MADKACEGEEFIHVGKDTEDMEKLREEIKTYKEKHSSLLNEIEALEKERQDYENATGKYQSKLDKLQSRISDYGQTLNQNEQEYEDKCRLVQDEHLELSERAKEMKEEIDGCERTTKELEKVCLSGMERKMVFMGNIADYSSGLSVKHQIRYPVNGGSALITFKVQSVAAEVISDRHHTINVEDCRIYVKAEPVELLVLDTLCMGITLSPTKVLVYNLPPNLSEGFILDKLELYFAKSRNGGGEVDKTEFLSDCRGAIITFINDSVASRLLRKKSFLVPFGSESTHHVYVAPSLDGNLQNYKMKRLMCNRTVLLTGIPDITDKDNQRDLLELHFHKISNDGVQALMYCPEGESSVVFFEDDQDDLTTE